MLPDIKNLNIISSQKDCLEVFFIFWEQIEDFQVIINKLIQPPLVKQAAFVL